MKLDELEFEAFQELEQSIMAHFGCVLIVESDELHRKKYSIVGRTDKRIVGIEIFEREGMWRIAGWSWNPDLEIQRA